MIRTLAFVLVLLPSLASPQEAVVLPEASAVTDTADGGVAARITLSQAVPYRIFTLDRPRRLVVDFAGLGWDGVMPDTLDQADGVAALRFGTFRPGWSRLVLDLAAPLALETAEMSTDQGAVLSMILRPTSAVDFAGDAGAPADGAWAQIAENAPDLPAPTPDDGPVTVVIDPGHGGIDPGAIQGGVHEADLMLALGQELVATLNRSTAIRALLTRETDAFVSLEGRMTIARAARADLFISLHADALEQEAARGASVYTLSARGADRAAQRMAERHERGDMLAGLDLSGQGDRVATVLMDLARAETFPRSERFANTVVGALENTGVRLNTRPLRQGQFAVLNAPDFAAVLIETGFLSNPRDRALLATPEGRAPIVIGLADAIQLWAQEEAALASRLRQ